jgi:hypothetical protein
VDGPAESVRSRPPTVAPLAALRAHLVDTVAGLVGSHRCPDRRRYIATLEASDGLRAYERELVHESELKVRQALLEAWAADAGIAPQDPESAALLISATWLATSRSLVVGQRPRLIRGADPDASAADVMNLADRVLREMENTMMAASGTPSRWSAATDTGWPEAVRRAG